MNPPQVYMCSPSWTLLPPPSPFWTSYCCWLSTRHTHSYAPVCVWVYVYTEAQAQEGRTWVFWPWLCGCIKLRFCYICSSGFQTGACEQLLMKLASILASAPPFSGFSCSPSHLCSAICTLSPGGSDGNKSACNAGDPGSIPGWGRSPGEGNSNHSSFLAWRIPWTEEPDGL